MLHISKKHRPVYRPFKYERRDHGALAQAGDKRNDFPVPLRRIANQPLSALTTTAQPHHARACPGLVDKHQSSRVKHALLSHPTLAGADVFRTLLLCRVQSFFLKLMFRRSRTATPRCGCPEYLLCAWPQRSRPTLSPDVRRSTSAKIPHIPQVAKCCRHLALLQRSQFPPSAGPKSPRHSG